MKMLGLNPMEQEVIDLTNNIVKNGYIYFPDFCKTILEKYRQDDEEVFRQNMFKVRLTLRGKYFLFSPFSYRCYVARSLSLRNTKQRNTNCTTISSPGRTSSTS